MEHKHHYSGLTDEQVLESRAKYGTNVLTPPEEETTWQKIKDCMHFWLLKLDLVILVLSVLAAVILPTTGIYTHTGLWIAPVLAAVLFFLTYLVAYLGGSFVETVNAFDSKEGKFIAQNIRKLEANDLIKLNSGKELTYIKYGNNDQSEEKKRQEKLLHKSSEKSFDIDSLFTILLFALLLSGAISFYKGVIISSTIDFSEFFEPIGIAVAVLLATTVAHILESQNEKTFKSLNQVNDDTLVKAIRNNNVCQVARKDIVVGDIIILETGEEVPADAELLEALNLNMNESSLTGEPQCAKTTDPASFDNDATYPSNHIMKGCTVIEGYCTAKVFAVGDATACGKVFEAAQVREGEATPLSEKLDELASLITKTSYVLAILIVLGRLIRYAILQPESNILALSCFLGGSLVLAGLVYWILNRRKTEDTEESMELWQVLSFMLIPIIGVILYFVIGSGAGTEWSDLIKYALDSVMIAVTLIVVAVPEGLPMAVTLSLAFSMKRLMKQNTLPRTMHACETMGAVSVICSDKTGTLTKNQMQVWETDFANLNEQKLTDDEISNIIKECIAVNTTANLDFSDASKIKAIGNPTEGALLLWLNKQGINYLPIREDAEFVDRLPFTTENKYMATIVNSKVNGKKILYLKGAPEIILELTTVSEDERLAYDAKLAEYQSKAMRTLGFAYIEVGESVDTFYEGKLAIKGLTMLGVVAISDPVRDEVPAAIKECLDAGIQIKIVTGDTPGTAKEIGRQVGIWTDADTDENILIGQDMEKMSDDELKKRLPLVKIISRARPNDKERAVRVLKELDEVVAVTGDGTNDAPALNVANVGLSMGDGTAVAKEASDMTIIDNSFSTIANAVMWGRSLYKNIKRFILFQMTVNVAACLIVLIGAFIGSDSPLTVTQMLWVNLIMDTFAALALASLPPTRKVMNERPRSVNEHILKGMGTGILGVGGIFTVLLLGIFVFFQHTDITSSGTLMDVFKADFTWGAGNGLSKYELGLFFTIFVMLQFWNLFNAKAFMTNDSAFKGLTWKNTNWFIIIVIVIFVGQVIMTEVPGVQEMFNVAKGGIKLMDWLAIVVATSFVLWIGELIRLTRKKRV